jgi:hypothetical protein
MFLHPSHNFCIYITSVILHVSIPKLIVFPLQTSVLLARCLKRRLDHKSTLLTNHVPKQILVDLGSPKTGALGPLPSLQLSTPRSQGLRLLRSKQDK